MWKNRVLFVLSVWLFTNIGYTQILQGFNYQAVIRDIEGQNLANQNVTLRFSVWHLDSPESYIAYQETLSTTSNEFGLVNCVVGTGTPTIGSWNAIDWDLNNIPFPWQLRTEVDAGNGFMDLGSRFLHSVPYAELAKGNWAIKGNEGTDDNLNFIGTTDAVDLVFKTNSTEKLRLSSVGNLGLGTDTPGQINNSYFGGKGFHIRNDGLSYIMLETPGYGKSLIRNNSIADLEIECTGNFSLAANGMELMTIEGETWENMSVIMGNGYDTEQGIPLIVRNGDDASLTNSESGYLLLGSVVGTNILIDNNEIMTRNNGNSDELYLQAEGGAVVVNSSISTTTHALYVNGSAAKPGGGSWTATSDERLKDNVEPFNLGLEEVLKIEPVTYHYIENTGHDTSIEYVGVIAQDIQKIAPDMVAETEMEMVDGTKDQYLSVDPSAFTYMLINAVKDLKAENEALQMEISSLKSMEARLVALEKLLVNEQSN